MKLLKTTLSLLLAALLAASLCLCAFAADGIVLSGAAGENVTWTLTADGLLTVSGSGPIVDEKEEEIDEDGYSSWTILGSIGMTLSDYYDTLSAGKNAADAARILFDLVKDIVIEEGITEIPENEFDSVYPRRVSTPASLTRLGYGAFNLQYAEEIVIKSTAVFSLQCSVLGYEDGAEPYADPDAAVAGYIDLQAAQEAYDISLLPLDALRTYLWVKYSEEYCFDSYMSEEDVQEALDFYNESFGADAGTLEALTPTALALLNRNFGLDCQSAEDVFSLNLTEWGDYELVIADAALEAAIDAPNPNNRANPAYNMTLGFDYEDMGLTAYDWLTVTAPAGGQIEEDCRTTGVTFKALEGAVIPGGPETENACKFCGKDHTGSFWQKLVGFAHKVLYFFAHLFGRM